MFIESLKVEYPFSKWTLEETHFDVFNLLVGASGVGKTRILEALLLLRDIATGGDLLNQLEDESRLTWEVKFGEEKSAEFFTWAGSLFVREIKSANALIFEYESISQGSKSLATRRDGGIFVGGLGIPKLNPSDSLVSLLREESSIEPIFHSFSGIFDSEHETFEDGFSSEGVYDLSKFDTLAELRNSSECFRSKLWWLFNNREKSDLFDVIRGKFLEIFPNFKDLSMYSRSFPSHSPDGIVTFVWLEFVEKGTEVELEYDHLASGMKRTLDILGQVHLLPDNSVILIDEFENSLGVNCLSAVTEEILNAGRGLQFIITSHHPYIIGNIDFKHWKIVTRDGGRVTARPALETGIGRSKQERFFQLINLEEFRTGKTKARA
jgi:predicted ATPase